MMAVMEVQAGGDLAALHRREYRSLVRLASLLLSDAGAAEEVVQDAFVKVYLAGDRVQEPLQYLRRAVVNGARSGLRRRYVRARAPLAVVRDSSDTYAEDRDEVMAALRALPQRQRECLVLRYYLDLSEADIAHALGISAGSVKTHSHRGIAALEKTLEGLR
jgi:RNA polymerase sigma-70 factor (sigma-E family)